MPVVTPPRIPRLLTGMNDPSLAGLNVCCVSRNTLAEELERLVGEGSLLGAAQFAQRVRSRKVFRVCLCFCTNTIYIQFFFFFLCLNGQFLPITTNGIIIVVISLSPQPATTTTINIIMQINVLQQNEYHTTNRTTGIILVIFIQQGKFHRQDFDKDCICLSVCLMLSKI